MRIGVDSGGTFTDFVVLRDNATLEVFKLRSNAADPASVILEGVRRATRLAPKGDIVDVVHGSTVATNALLERKGARTAFISSPGFRDLLVIGRQNRSDLYSLRPENRVTLVSPKLATEWTGDPAVIRAWVEHAQPESIAVCLLGAFEDQEEELRVKAALCDTRAYFCRSSEIAPEFREYERASTTVLNAYVGPLMERYLSRLESDCPHSIRIMQSNGGLLTTAEARQHAVRTILSGPAGGVAGAQAMAARAGWKQAIAFDMGGTSTDVSVVEHPVRFATEAWIAGLPVRVPMLDIHTVGAGGGSLASVDGAGRLRVGPESAGANPGPACYGIGEQATVTDAHVVLGRISAQHFLDGAMAIDVVRAERAVAAIGSALRVSSAEGASAIIRMANSNMERAIRVVSVEKGRDLREFPLIAFGGCGGLHACEIAQELDIRTVLFPPFAGALSALGMLLAVRTRDYAAGVLNRSDYADLVARLATQASEDMPGSTVTAFADIRYRGQSYELTVPWQPLDPRQPFEEAYLAIYGFASPDRPIEVVTLRVRATGQDSDHWFTNARNRSRRSSAAAHPRIRIDHLHSAVMDGAQRSGRRADRRVERPPRTVLTRHKRNVLRIPVNPGISSGFACGTYP